MNPSLDPGDLTPYGIFFNVIGGPAAVPFYIGWGLLTLGYLWSLINNQLRAIRGQPRPHSEIVANVALHAALLASYALISKWVWVGTQGIASAVYPQTELLKLLGMLKELASRFQTYTFSFSLTNVAQGIKDSVVGFVAITSWILALVSHYQIQQIQIGVFNVIFVFGPLLIGAGAFGLPTARIWAFALIEVSSWSISAAALYHGLHSSFQRYLDQANQGLSLLDGSFLDAINNLVFLSTAMIIVPVITGRLLGSATLGELSHIQASNSTWAARIGAFASGLQGDNPRADNVISPNRSASKKTRPGD